MNNRPVLYSAACFLSFVGSGIAVVTFFAMALFYDFFAEKIISVTNMNSLNGTSPWYFTMFGVCYTFSLVGVIKLWKFRTIGLYYYALAQVGIMIMPVVVIGSNAFSTTNAIFTVLFVSIYFYYYRWIKGIEKINLNKPNEN